MNDGSGNASVAMSGASAATTDGFRITEKYRWYVIWLLFTIYVFNFVDRSILVVLVQPIKLEFGLSDTQLGLLGGLAFAVLYSTLGIPIARLADRSNRVNIISVSLFAWSLFTALTGFATSFTHLLLARIAVGIGEAGCSPPAYSLISDYFDQKRRTTALAIYSMGISGGVFLGLVVSAVVAQRWGWRSAFYVVGVPGLLLAVLVKMTLREPPRGFADGVIAAGDPPPVGQVLSTLWGKRAFRQLSIAAALTSFVGYGAGSFYAAFLMRSHGMSMVQVGLSLGTVTAIGGFIGTFSGGLITDRLLASKNDVRYQLWLPGVSLLANVPLVLLVYAMPSGTLALAMLLLVLTIGSMYLGPTFATAQRLLAPRERALGSALLLFIINLIGLGFGPLVTGVLSDTFQARFLAGGASAEAASAEGLVWALRAGVVFNIWAALHFFAAARALPDDVVS